MLLSPSGRLFDQRVAAEYAALGSLCLVCGRYEGVDERIAAEVVDEELSIGDGFLRSGFGTQIYLRRAAAGTLEYRMSLSRDTLKVGVFNDFAVYRALDALRAPVEVRVADTFGAGLHVLLFDAFQINSYLGLTVDQALGLDLGVKAELTRAF